MIDVARILSQLLAEGKLLAIEEDEFYGGEDGIWYLSGGALMLAEDEPLEVPVWVIYLRRQPSSGE